MLHLLDHSRYTDISVQGTTHTRVQFYGDNDTSSIQGLVFLHFISCHNQLHAYNMENEAVQYNKYPFRIWCTNGKLIKNFFLSIPSIKRFRYHQRTSRTIETKCFSCIIRHF